MNEPENFLQRWSRRKLDAELHEDAPQPAGEAARESGPQTADAPLPATLPAEPKQDEPEFDLTTLPSIESITSETDIRLFLQKGVPAELTRAALRRAWSADPAIRDFREIAENQWDFATGSDLPGFGPLDVSAEDVRRMVANVFEGFEQPEPEETPGPESAGTVPNPEPGQAEDTTLNPVQSKVAAPPALDLPAPQDAPGAASSSIVQRDEEYIAAQYNSAEDEYQPLPAGRRRGGALPQ